MSDIREKFALAAAPLAGRGVLVGFSGGSDSAALLLLLLSASGRLGTAVSAVHFEHGLRGGAGRADAEWCRAFCLKRGVPFRMVSLDVPSRLLPGESIEAAARRLRLEEFARLASDGSAVALAHHSGDRVENLFMRLARGSNSSGLAAPRPEQVVNGVHIFRPLLGFSKGELAEFLRSEGVSDWREDHTNAEDCCLRNFIRNKLLPELRRAAPFSEKGLVRSVAALECDAVFLEESADKAFGEISGLRKTPASFWKGLPPAILIRVLRRWISSFLGRDLVPDFSLAGRLSDALGRGGLDGEPRSVPVDDTLSVVVQRGRVFLRASGEEAPPETLLWDWRREPSVSFCGFVLEASEGTPGGGAERGERTVRFDAALMPDSLELRVFGDGDRMVPFGRRTPVRVKRLLTDAKLDSDLRRRLPLVRVPGGGIIWIPGVRRSSFAPVAEDARAVVELKIRGA